MKKSERSLLIITVGTALLSLLYICQRGPGTRTALSSNAAELRNTEYLNILRRKDAIRERYKGVLVAGYWKNSLQEQRTTFQIYMENAARRCGIARIKSIVPAPESSGRYDDEIVLQMDVECSIGALARLLFEAGASGVPLQIRRLQINGETGEQDILKAQVEIATIYVNVDNRP